VKRTRKNAYNHVSHTTPIRADQTGTDHMKVLIEGSVSHAAFKLGLYHNHIYAFMTFFRGAEQFMDHTACHIADLSVQVQLSAKARCSTERSRVDRKQATANVCLELVEASKRCQYVTHFPQRQARVVSSRYKGELHRPWKGTPQQHLLFTPILPYSFQIQGYLLQSLQYAVHNRRYPRHGHGRQCLPSGGPPVWSDRLPPFRLQGPVRDYHRG
jgi:hypothetical protein